MAHLPPLTKLVSLNSKPVAGYLQIVKGFSIACQEKPSQEHLDNMFKQFGWVWLDNVLSV